MPTGADTVVPIERIVERAAEVDIADPVVRGDNIRRRGGDVEAGATILAGGESLTPARLAALAACGIQHITCRRAPRVAIVVTGTELRPPGQALEAGQIYESNGIMLAAALAQAGAAVERLGVTEDSEDALAEALERALEADVVVTSGGVSVGPHDLVRRVEARLGVEEVFWGVAMRPGKPLAFGVRGRTLVFGLPGNPVSSLVGALLFVRPALLALQGHPDPAPRSVRAPWPARSGPGPNGTTRSGAGHVERRRGLLDPIVGQESHMIVQMTSADAIVHIPRGRDVPAGARADFLVL